METQVLVLLLVFQLKHLLADYYLQIPYMYENKGKETGWVKPLAAHSAVHSIFTFVIATVALELTGYGIISVFYGLGLAAFDFITHFVTDRWKATRGVGPDTSKFWIDLGIDQMIHHIVGILIVYSLFLLS